MTENHRDCDVGNSLKCSLKNSMSSRNKWHNYYVKYTTFVWDEKLPITDFLIYLAMRLCRRRPVVKISSSANFHCMTHDIYIVKRRTNKHKQTDVLLYVNDGCGLNNCYSI